MMPHKPNDGLSLSLGHNLNKSPNFQPQGAKAYIQVQDLCT